MKYLTIFFVILMTSTNIWSQMTPTMSTNDTLLQQFFSTCIPDETGRVIPGQTEVSPIPSLPEPQDRDVNETSMTEDELRMVHWVHGFGGDVNSWFSAALAFEHNSDNTVVTPRKLVSDTEIDYSAVEDNPLSEVAQHLGNQLVNNASNDSRLSANYDRLNSIAIGHSQGGIVTRRIDQHQSTNSETSTRFGGLVTFNSPNQGALIADPEQQNIILDFLEDLSSDLLAGPSGALVFEAVESIVDFIPDFLLSLFSFDVDIPTGEQIADKLSSILIEDILSFYLDITIPNITEDYTPSSAELQSLNSYESDMTSILAIGSERPVVTYEDGVELESDGGTYTVDNFPVPIAWANIHYFLNKASSYDLFEADRNEKETAVTMENTRLYYIAEKLDYEEKLRKNEKERSEARRQRDLLCSGFGGLFNPLCWTLRTKVGNLNRLVDKNQSVVDGFDLGINALNNFNNNYLTAMGLRELDQTIEEEQYCICFSGSDLEESRTGPFPLGTECIPPSSNEPGGSGQGGGYCYSIIEEVVINNWTILPSDGLFSVEVQSSIPQATEAPVIISRDNPRVWNWSQFQNIRINYGSTHMAIRNDDIGKNALISLFEGDFGLFYETDEVD